MIYQTTTELHQQGRTELYQKTSIRACVKAGGGHFEHIFK